MPSTHIVLFFLSSLLTYAIASMVSNDMFEGKASNSAATSSANSSTATDGASRPRVELSQASIEAEVEADTKSSTLPKGPAESATPSEPVRHQASPRRGEELQLAAISDFQTPDMQSEQAVVSPLENDKLPINDSDSGWLISGTIASLPPKSASQPNKQFRKRRPVERSESSLRSRQGSDRGSDRGNADFERKHGHYQPEVRVDRLPAEKVIQQGELLLVAVTGSHFLQLDGDLEKGQVVISPFQSSAIWSDVALAVPPQKRDRANAALVHKLRLNASASREPIKYHYLVSQSLLSRIRRSQADYARDKGVFFEDVAGTRGHLTFRNGRYEYQVTAGELRKRPARE